MGRREVEEGETDDPRSLELVMLLAFSVPIDLPAGNNSKAERQRKECLLPTMALMWCGAAEAAKGMVG